MSRGQARYEVARLAERADEVLGGAPETVTVSAAEDRETAEEVDRLTYLHEHGCEPYDSDDDTAYDVHEVLARNGQRW